MGQRIVQAEPDDLCRHKLDAQPACPGYALCGQFLATDRFGKAVVIFDLFCLF